jgi:outer membrane protein TolC
LKLLLGLELNTDLKLTDNLEGLTLTHLVLKEESSGYENNIDLRIAEGQITSEELLYKLERSKSLPSFKAFINGMYMGNNDTFGFTDKDQKWFGSSAFGSGTNPYFQFIWKNRFFSKSKNLIGASKTFFQRSKKQNFCRI